GLFDGVDPRGSDSNARMASLLKVPIILVIDTIGITRGIAPLLHGYSNFDPDINISGVILNKTGDSRHENKLRKAIEYYSDIPVLGSIDRNDSLTIAERHLGLTTPGEKSTAEPLIEQLAQTIEQCIDMEALLKIAGSSGHVSPVTPQRIEPSGQPDITIAIARDEAFGFYYPDDLEAFSRCGARLEFFSPLHDSQLPKADGLFIGGGFPETHMKELAANQPLRAQIKIAIAAGLPTYAECGGLMYLSRSIEWSGKTAQMVGAIPGECKMHQKPQGRGFARLQNTANHPWPGN
ncbi:MAG: cobyrinate a,c-diamide synthase, partial [bacterium]|nr:cobyrinate a,c-diamide synthase [bacterium]